MKAKFYITLLLCIAFLGASGYLYMQLDQVKKELDSARMDNDAAQRRVASLQDAKRKAEEELEAERARVDEFDKQIEKLSDELDKADEKIELLTQQVQESQQATTELDALKIKLKKADLEKSRLEKKLDQTVEKFESELQQLRQQKLELEQRFQEQTGEIPGAIRIEDVKIFTGKKFSGKVVAINKRYNFVIINIGKNDGLEEDTVLIVHRGKNFIGKVRVERVYEKMSAAMLLKDWMQDNIKTGDKIKKF
jgi:predicted RNase H-like nuclease (RuvC/YqgF family)